MISQTAEYALRAAVVLGSQQGRPLTTQEIARASQVPSGYLSKVLQAMGRSGLVEARRGLRGGYVLTHPLDELTVYDVVNAVDPLKRVQHCPLRVAAHAERLCPLHQRLDDAAAMLETYFKETTIASLLNEQHAPHPRPLCEPPSIQLPKHVRTKVSLKTKP
jgi:Rrf2 family transcriptional regulator, nitric oxide-sensitive transcriptional repressor